MPITEVPRGTYSNIPINSFSSADMFRIIAHNVTREERLHIIYFFVVVVPITGFLTDILEAISLIFKPSRLVLRILKFLNLVDNILERFNPLDAALLLMILPQEPRKEAKELLQVLQRDFLAS